MPAANEPMAMESHPTTASMSTAPSPTHGAPQNTGAEGAPSQSHAHSGQQVRLCHKVVISQGFTPPLDPVVPTAIEQLDRYIGSAGVSGSISQGGEHTSLTARSKLPALSILLLCVCLFTQTSSA